MISLYMYCRFLFAFELTQVFMVSVFFCANISFFCAELDDFDDTGRPGPGFRDLSKSYSPLF